VNILSLIEQKIRDEKKSIEFLIDKYHEKTLLLPKGTLVEKHCGDKTYYYLKYRDGKRIVSKYILNNEVGELKEKIQDRKHCEKMLKMLKDELNFAKRALGEKI